MGKIADAKGWGIMWSKGDSSYTFNAKDFERAVQEWKAGTVFLHTESVYGAELVIKLSAIESIQLSTPESIKAYHDDNDDDDKPWKTN